MTDWFDRLEAWGVDRAEIMERFVDDEGLYQECLNEFLKDKNFEVLQKALEAKDYDQAFQCAHSLKGAAGNLGLKKVYEPMSALTEELRHKTLQNMDQYEQQAFAAAEEVKHLLEP